VGADPDVAQFRQLDHDFASCSPPLARCG
jgi:hypothetical protein